MARSCLSQVECLQPRRLCSSDHCHLWSPQAFVHSDPAAAATLDWRDARPISEVVELLLGWDPDLVAAIKLFPKALHWRKVEESAAERWTSNNGRIVLLGDSVHPLPPSSFQVRCSFSSIPVILMLVHHRAARKQLKVLLRWRSASRSAATTECQWRLEPSSDSDGRVSPKR